MLQGLKNNLDSWDKAYDINQTLKFVTWPRQKIESEIKDSIEKCGFKGFISKPINNIEVESIYASIVKQ